MKVIPAVYKPSFLPNISKCSKSASAVIPQSHTFPPSCSMKKQKKIAQHLDAYCSPMVAFMKNKFMKVYRCDFMAKNTIK